jgi:predicted transcriptional regulator
LYLLRKRIFNHALQDIAPFCERGAPQMAEEALAHVVALELAGFDRDV